MILYKRLVIKDRVFVLVDDGTIPEDCTTVHNRYRQFFQQAYYYYGNSVRNITGYILAEVIGHYPGTISRKQYLLDSGKSWDMINKICDSFGLNPAWFVNTDPLVVVPLFKEPTGKCTAEDKMTVVAKQLLTK